MRSLRIHPAAAEEAARATGWYESQQPGLGRDFEAAVNAAMDVLGLEPVPSTAMVGASGKQGVRRLILKRFPYDVVFIERPGHVWVIAFAHHFRRPGFWRDRSEG